MALFVLGVVTSKKKNGKKKRKKSNVHNEKILESQLKATDETSFQMSETVGGGVKSAENVLETVTKEGMKAAYHSRSFCCV